VILLWEIARWLFTAYVRLFGVYSKLYGSFGIGVAALVWIYYSATIFVLGAELAAFVAERRQPRASANPIEERGEPAEAAARAVLQDQGGGYAKMFSYVLVAVLVSALTVFVLQNNAPTSLRFLAWTLKEIPLSVAILASMGVGIAVAGSPLLIARWRLRARTRALEARVLQLEERLAEQHHASGSSAPDG
jgi:uncharacterized integral membrane protein